MGEAGTNNTGAADTRGGKYCPRCQTMAFRDQAVCAYCGHQFRSAALPTSTSPVAPTVAPTPVPDDLHRTQQFTLPPLPRTPPAAEMPLPISPDPRPPLPRSPAIWAVWLCLLVLGVLAGAFWRLHRSPPVPTPSGAWTTTLRGTGAGAQSADLKFVFANGGDGTYSLGAAPPAPLHWTQNENTLFLTLTPPTPPDTQYSTLVTIFNNRPWVWKRDPQRHALTLGTLIFTEIPTETP